MTPTNCQICGWREYVEITDWDDGKRVRSCGVCLAPPTVPEGWEYEPADLVERFDPNRGRQCKSLDHSSRDAVYAAIASKSEGATAADVIAELGVTNWRSREYDVITNHLRLMVKSGCLRFSEAESHRFAGRMVRLYHAVKRPESKMNAHRYAIVDLKRQGLRNVEIANRLGATTTAVQSAVYEARLRGELPPIKRAA